MINRTMVRTRVIQTLFAFYKDGEKTSLTAKKELLRGFSDTYSLYMTLLDFVNELTRYAEIQIEEAEERAKITHTQYVANRKFVNNRLAAQLFNNHTLRSYIENERLSWDAGMSAVQAAYKLLLDSPFYKQYMASETSSYEEDKRVWRRIFADVLPACPALSEAMEELEIVLDKQNWVTDLDVILSFVVKTIKRFEEEKGSEQELLPMFEKEEELKFGENLLRHALENHDEYEQMIYSHLKNWDADRIAYMDKIILQVALAEIIQFPMIAIEISLNEYIEIAKEYSSEKSHIFINGILNEILLDLKRQNKLMKVMREA